MSEKFQKEKFQRKNVLLRYFLALSAIFGSAACLSGANKQEKPDEVAKSSLKIRDHSAIYTEELATPEGIQAEGTAIVGDIVYPIVTPDPNRAEMGPVTESPRPGN